MNIKFTTMESPWQERMKAMFPRLGRGFVLSEPGSVVMVPYFAENYHKFKHFELRQDDVWILSYPKAGSHWVQEMAWCILHDCNFDLARSTTSDLRFPLIDLDFIMDPDDSESRSPFGKTRFEIASEMKSPRFLKSHLPLSLLPHKLLDTSKVIYIARNPLDTVCSYHHHYKVVFGDAFTACMEDFLNAFMAEKLLWDPYRSNILEAWNKRNSKNMCIFFYEELHEDLNRSINKMCDFLGKTIDEENREKLFEHLSFDKFKKNESVNWEARKRAVGGKHDFLRKGKIGSWKEELTDDQVETIKQMMETHFEPEGLHFTIE